MAQCSKCKAEFQTFYMDTVETCPRCGTTYWNDNPGILYNEVSGTQDASKEKKAAAVYLQAKILKSVQRYPNTRWHLGSISGEQAVCYGWPHDGVDFFLNLETGKIEADLIRLAAESPNGRVVMETISIAPELFCEIAKKNDFDHHLQCLQTEEDWQQVVDSELIAAVKQAQIHEKQSREQQNRELLEKAKSDARQNVKNQAKREKEKPQTTEELEKRCKKNKKRGFWFLILAVMYVLVIVTAKHPKGNPVPILLILIALAAAGIGNLISSYKISRKLKKDDRSESSDS